MFSKTQMALTVIFSLAIRELLELSDGGKSHQIWVGQVLQGRPK